MSLAKMIGTVALALATTIACRDRFMYKHQWVNEFGRYLFVVDRNEDKIASIGDAAVILYDFNGNRKYDLWSRHNVLFVKWPNVIYVQKPEAVYIDIDEDGTLDYEFTDFKGELTDGKWEAYQKRKMPPLEEEVILTYNRKY